VRVASLLVGLLGALGWSAAGAAAIITVNVLTDTGGERCPATCSLRAALATARAGDEIQFSVTGTILLSQGQLVVDKNVTITGPGESSLAIDGNQASRVLQVNSGVTATLSGLTIQNGVGGEFVVGGGGIFNNGTLTLTNCTLSGNNVYDGYDGIETSGVGGGILNFGTAVLTNCTLSGNGAPVGGIANTGDLTLTNSIVSDNRANDIELGGEGGGIYNTDTATLRVTNSTISGNSGRGILNFGTAVLTNSILSGNSTPLGPLGRSVGGGVDNIGTLTLTNSTISGNHALYGGGIFNSGTAVLTNCTLSDNSSDFESGGSAIYGAGGTLSLASSIVANSIGQFNCLEELPGSITSHGDNLSSDATCVATDATLNDQNTTDPLLDPAGLQDNGGSTLTIALQSGSPAIDAVRYNTCPPPDTDQRGFLRPAHGENGTGARCDIGAFEFNALPPVVNSLVTFVPLTSTYQTTLETTGCPGGFAGTFRFTARLTAKASSPVLTDLRVQVQTLTNGNLLQNADGGPGGVGATVTVPQVGAFVDGILSPEDAVDVPFVVCLQEPSPFRFFVDVLGIVSDEGQEQRADNVR
jgi:hypothetical protein